MAIRNMVEVAKSTENKVPVWYQLTIKELETLYEMEKWDAFATAFYYGFALALRMVKRDAWKNKAGLQVLEE